MRRRIGKFSRAGLAYYAILIIAIAVGWILGRGIGNTIVAIAGAILAFTIFATVGLGKAATDGVSGGRRGLRR